MPRRGRPQGNTVSRLGLLILQAMKLHRLNYEQIAEESELLAQLNQNDDLRIGRSTLGNIISGRIRQPSAAKVESLSKILQLARADVDRALGLVAERRSHEQLGRRHSQTHEIERDTIMRRRLLKLPILKSDENLSESQFLSGLLDQWVHVDPGYLAQLYPPNIRYFVIGEADRFRSPIVPAGSRVLVDTHLTFVPGPEPVSFHLRELFCVETRRGLSCCYLETAPNNRIALVPHPMSGHIREEYQASAVTIIGGVMGILLPS